MQDKKERRTKSGLRGVTRLYAVQKLYQFGMTGEPVEKIVEESCGYSEVFVSENVSLSEIDSDFFNKLLKTTAKNLAVIDETISENLSDNWKLDRLDYVMKSILRLGIAELLYFKDIPANVVFNEYIEISKSFFDKEEVAFVNGLLNSVTKKS